MTSFLPRPDTSRNWRSPTRIRIIGRQKAHRPASRKKKAVPATGLDLQAPLRVLLVDDDPNFVEFLTQLLSRAGMDILTANSGQQCLEQVRQSTALDVIILDVVMPGMNGLEVCSALQQLGPSHFVPVILLTAKNDLETRLAAMRLGVSEFIVKPVRNKELVSRIRAQADVSHKIRAMEQTQVALNVDPKKVK